MLQRHIHVHDFLKEKVIANRIQLGGSSDKKFNYCFSVRKYGKNKVFLFQERIQTREGIVAVILYSREREEEKNKEKVE